MGLIYKIKIYMLVSKILLNIKGIPIKTQHIDIKCDDCGKEWKSLYYNYLKGLLKYKMDLCRGCKQKFQIRNGIRSPEQYIKAGKAYTKKYKGKTYEEICGVDKALNRKSNKSEQMKGEKNPMFGQNYQTYGLKKWVNDYQKGKTYEEIYGVDKAKQIKSKLSELNSGKNNNMYGKPSPQGSGNGWSGWYKGWFFRSLKELSFMINVIERFGFKWENAEKKKYKISYKDYDGTDRNYFADFVLDKKYLVEIKPKNLHKSVTVLLKKEAAIDYCDKNNLNYKLIDSKDLTFEKINKLYMNNDIIFIERYEKKFIDLKNN